jgi:hypothetical protein
VQRLVSAAVVAGAGTTPGIDNDNLAIERCQQSRRRL